MTSTPGGNNVVQFFEAQAEAEGTPEADRRMQEAVRNHKLAVMQMRQYVPAVNEGVIHVEKLAGDVMAENRGGQVFVDPVAFKSADELKTVYGHEFSHDVIPNEGMVQKKLVSLGIPGVKERAEMDYIEEQRRVDEVTSRIGTKKAVSLYEKGEFTELCRVFAHVCMNEGMQKAEIDRIFFAAFPELKFEKQNELPKQDTYALAA